MKWVFGLFQHSKFIVDCIILSISSAIGQMFIFYTIANFGPVVFTIIMTLRQVNFRLFPTFSTLKSPRKPINSIFLMFQAIAILLSCIVYKHYISAVGIFGIIIVFLALFLRVYCNQRMKMLRHKTEANKSLLNSTKSGSIVWDTSQWYRYPSHLITNSIRCWNQSEFHFNYIFQLQC